MEVHHISADKPHAVKCIDIYLNHEGGEVQIVDATKTSNRISISALDWNELVDRIKAEQIGKIRL